MTVVNVPSDIAKMVELLQQDLKEFGSCWSSHRAVKAANSGKSGPNARTSDPLRHLLNLDHVYHKLTTESLGNGITDCPSGKAASKSADHGVSPEDEISRAAKSLCLALKSFRRSCTGSPGGTHEAMKEDFPTLQQAKKHLLYSYNEWIKSFDNVNEQMVKRVSSSGSTTYRPATSIAEGSLSTEPQRTGCVTRSQLRARGSEKSMTTRPLELPGE